MGNTKPLTLQGYCPTISETDFLTYIAPELADNRGELETFGPWHIPVRFQAPAVSYVWGEFNSVESITFYGKRTMYNLRESGYCLEGRVSIGGRKYSAFTSSLLLSLPDKRLIETATIHTRIHSN